MLRIFGQATRHVLKSKSSEITRIKPKTSSWKYCSSLLQPIIGLDKPSAVASYSHYPYKNARMRYISSTASQSAKTVEAYNNHTAHQFEPRWLRENCRCDACYNHTTEQRNILFHEFSREQLQVAKRTSDSEEMTIEWADGHLSSYKWQWLMDNKHPGITEPKVKQELWDGAKLSATNLDEVPIEDLLNEGPDEEGLKRLLRSLLRYGIGIVRNVPADIEATQRVAERVSFVQETIFGGMWSVQADQSRGDTAYTKIDLGAHTDTTYFSLPVGLQVFHCTHHHGDGGDTLLVDGFHVAEQLRQDDPDAFWTLCTHRIHHQYIESGHHLISLDPVLKVHPVSEAIEMIRYNHYDRNPLSTIPQEDVAEYYRSLEALSVRMSHPDNTFWIKLRPGTMLFVDNWRVLHGRSAFTGDRKLCGCYLPRDDWIDKARVLGLI